MKILTSIFLLGSVALGGPLPGGAKLAWDSSPAIQNVVNYRVFSQNPLLAQPVWTLIATVPQQADPTYPIPLDNVPRRYGVTCVNNFGGESDKSTILAPLQPAKVTGARIPKPTP